MTLGWYIVFRKPQLALWYWKARLVRRIRDRLIRNMPTCNLWRHHVLQDRLYCVWFPRLRFDATEIEDCETRWAGPVSFPYGRHD